MDDITVNETTTLDEDKTVTITSYSEDGNVNSVIRNEVLTERLLTLERGSLSLESIVIDGNNILVDNAMISVGSKSTLNIKNNTIITKANSSGQTCGGAIYVDNGIVNMTGGSIENNVVDLHNGAGICAVGDSKLTINGGNIVRNSSPGSQGGGIMLYGNAELKLLSGNISNNKVKGNGGGIYVFGNTKFTMTGGTISNNEAGDGGGAISCGINAVCTIEGGVISYNKATYGGAIRTDLNEGNPILNISGTASIEHNTATSNGGGIVLYNGNTNFKMNGGTISNNIANKGGGIYSEYANVTVESGNITENTVTGSGGGLSINAGIFNMTGGVISNNSITEDGAGHDGGGMLLNNVTSKISGGTVKSNTSLHGAGGVQTNRGTLTIQGGEIINNTRSGLDVYNDSKIIITGGTINNNSLSSSPYNNNIAFSDNTSTFIEQKTNSTIMAKKHFIATTLNNNFVVDVTSAAVANDTNIQLYTKNNVSAQKWRILPYRVVNGVVDYIIQSQINQTQYMWVRGNSSVSGTNVITYTFHGSAGGYWRLTNQGNSYYQVKNINGLCLDLVNGTAANGTNIWAYTCNNTNTQKWKFVETT